MQTCPLYIMISQTDTGIGKCIRQLSQYPYNHVAMTLDPSLRQWYAFARFRVDAPLYSGFLMEPVERYLAKGYPTPVRIFRLEISLWKSRQLQSLFDRAATRDSGLLYNYLDAAAAYFGYKIAIPGAYTCLGFACAVLEEDFRTIEALNDALAPQLFYEGNLVDRIPDSGSRRDPYFQPIGLLRGSWVTFMEIIRLLRHLVFCSTTDIVQQKLHSSI